MARPRARCPLCQSTETLVDSHLMPAALYKAMREEDGGDPNPVVTAKGSKSHQTSRQVSNYVLCASCDGSLSENGEKYALSQMLQADGSFPLQGSLKKMRPSVADAKAGLFEIGDSGDINAAQFSHFAAGVFWKAAVHEWSRPGSGRMKLDLKEELADGLRLYLRGESEWPDSAVLHMFVAGEVAPPCVMFFPKQYANDPIQHCSFYVPGIEFHLQVGDPELLEQVARSSLSSARPASAIVLHMGEFGITDRAVEAVKASGPSRRLKEWLEREGI